MKATLKPSAPADSRLPPATAAVIPASTSTRVSTTILLAFIFFSSQNGFLIDGHLQYPLFAANAAFQCSCQTGVVALLWTIAIDMPIYFIGNGLILIVYWKENYGALRPVLRGSAPESGLHPSWNVYTLWVKMCSCIDGLFSAVHHTDVAQVLSSFLEGKFHLFNGKGITE
jgi:hypothetical protein